ncbi:class I SAM-dependent methyltransferase [Alkalihalobacillus sp. AL-G]|uniref:class I SAM-dependent methyltransferase n=1 Tax=Alkalihalobacillus sp. AL-G TaxID=2926399 RepID=UPI00272B497C|nr:class I SAM-dependent methyltransferase [Alkalihalobacillus sp. AL-G]WLD92625.1 class I SAM-dependent methyltransferase [Alkalihalobacillus sp. AL-G]
MAILYDGIGKTYDTTRRADPEIARRLKSHLQVSDGASVVDIACGTGNYTIALEGLGLHMTGVDISAEMITKAKSKSKSIKLDIADAQNLPYSKSTFDGATCTLSIHHFDNLSAPFQEVFRVIDKGRFVIFTSSPEQMENYWLKEYFPEAIRDSAEQMPSLSKVTDTLREAGFAIIGQETFLMQPDLQDFFLYSGKYEPKMYLDENVRSGISTFVNIASREEIEEGCSRLKRDIETNKINDVLANYSSDLGDYAFVIAEKK